MGMTTEIDESEAMAGYYSLRWSLWAIAGVTLVLCVAATLISVMLGERATRAMRQARDRLEERVEERTREVK